MKKLIFVFTFIALVLLPVTSLADSTSEALTSAQIESILIDSDPVGYYPPYDKDDFPQEYIDPIQGSLTLTENILYLPGKNGLDLNLSASYNSTSRELNYYDCGSAFEQAFEKDAYYYSYDDNGEKKTILICPYNEEELIEIAPLSFYAEELPRMYTDDLDTEYYRLSDFDTTKQNILFTRETQLEPGWIYYDHTTSLTTTYMSTSRFKFSDIWEWNLPVFSYRIRPVLSDNDGTYKFYGQTVSFTDLDNEYCTAYFEYAKKISTGDITATILSITRDKATYTGKYLVDDTYDSARGITYCCYITDSIGRTMFFNKHGYLQGIEDRFGNIIKFYTTTTTKSCQINKIVDSLGRIIEFEYINNDVYIYVDYDGDGLNRELYCKFLNTFENNDALDPNKEFVADNNYTSSIVRYESANTEHTKTFEYKKRNLNIYKTTIKYYTTPLPCNIIYKVCNPNMLSNFYTYERTSFLSGSYKELYSVQTRYNKLGNDTFNEYTYVYDPGTGTVVTREADGTTMTYTGKKYPETKETAFGDTTLNESYSYASNRFALNSVSKSYYSNNKRSNSHYEYTQHTNGLLKRIKYDDYEKNITYHDNSAFVKTEIYAQNENTFIKTVYTLSEEDDDYYQGRTIDSMTVYVSNEGDVDSKYEEQYSVYYTYNPDGTLASSTTDPDGINQVTLYSYFYNSDGSITTAQTATNLKDPDGNALPNIVTSSTVDSHGRLIDSCDGNGNLTTYQYDNLGRLTKQTNPDNTTRTYSYDTVNRTVIFTDENGIMQKTQYDGFGNVIAAYKNAGTAASPNWVATFEYEYDSLCRPVSVTNYTAFNGTTPTKWLTTEYTYGFLDHIAQTAVYDENDNELSKDTYTYNFSARIGASTSLNAHDKANSGSSYKFTQVTIESAAKDGITPPVVTQFYNRQDKLVKQIRTDCDNEYISSQTYDYVGNVLEVKSESAYADFDVDYSAKYEYNYNNKVIREYNAEENYIEHTYDTLGRLTSSTDYLGNIIATYTYDSIGRTLTVSSPVDTAVTADSAYYYDSNSNLTKEVKSTASGNVNYTYYYDNRNRLLSEFDGSTYTANIYDGNHLVKTVSGLSSYTSDAYELTPLYPHFNVTDFEYDNLGNLVTETTYNGSTTYTYDLAGNTLTTTDPKGTTTTNTYDSQGNLLSSVASGDAIYYAYNSFGLVTSASRGDSYTTYTYNNLLQNVTETTGTNVITRAYNTQGQVTDFSLTNGEAVLQSATYEYNVLGNMTSASDGSNTVTYSYNENGLPITEQKSTFITSYEYTPGNLIKQVTHTRRWTNDPTDEEGYNTIYNVSSFAYTYYPDGNVQSVSDTRNTTSYVTNYSYDSANRLTSTNITNGDALVRSWAYVYNNRGDRTSQTVTDADNVATTTNYTYTNHRLTRETTNGVATTYTYDANGNTLSKTCGEQATTYTYSPRNEVASVTTDGVTYRYTYNASSLRTSKSVNGSTTQFIWAGDNIIREEASTKATNYFYGVNRVSRTVTGSAYTYDVVDSYYDESIDDYVDVVIPVNGYHEFYAYDGRGNVVHTMALDVTDLYILPFYGSTSGLPEVDFNGDGSIDLTDITRASSYYPIVRNYYYSPFGEIWQGEVSSDTNPFRYAGEYLDKETGDIYLRARYYNPSIGRFITVDPIKDGTNWYVYCSNNPIAFVDPSGLIPTAEEAAYMAEHIYGATDKDKNIYLGYEFGGWMLQEIIPGEEGLYMGVYYRTVDGVTEYALVNKGTNSWGDWENNLQQPFGWSTDMNNSIQNATSFVNDHNGAEVTMIGHSKGGAEAVANAVATNTNCIVFNPATTSLGAYGLSANDYSADMVVYVVKGEMLNAVEWWFSKPIGEVISLEQKYPTDWYLPLVSIVYNSYKNHSMEAVIWGLINTEEK